MLNAISKLIAMLLVGWFILWGTYHIGAGLGNWFPFGAAIFGLVMGIVFCIVEAVKKNRDGQ